MCKIYNLYISVWGNLIELKKNVENDMKNLFVSPKNADIYVI